MTNGTAWSSSSHGHWDCYHGVSTSALLKACLNIGSGKSKALESEIVEYVEPIIHQFSQSINVRLFLHGLSQQQKDEDFSKELLRTRLDISVLLKFISNEKVQFPPWARRVVKATLTDVSNALRIANEDPFVSLETILEITATAFSLDWLNVTSFSCSCIPLVYGPAQHESAPIPSHAVMQLLIGLPTYSPESFTNIPLLTPSGVALLKVLTKSQSSFSSSSMPKCLIPRFIGMGTSSAPPEADKNMTASLRLIVGDVAIDSDSNHCRETITKSPMTPNSRAGNWKMDKLLHLTTNVDDTTPEVLAFCVDKLLQFGAADAWVQPIVMKKGRPAHALHCVAVENDSTCDKLMEIMFCETGTLGIRIERNLDRAALHREIIPIQTPFVNENQTKGIVNVKVGYLGSNARKQVVSVKAEFDHCQSIAGVTGVPLKVVAANATSQVWAKLDKEEIHYQQDQGRA